MLLVLSFLDNVISNDNIISSFSYWKYVFLDIQL